MFNMIKDFIIVVFKDRRFDVRGIDCFMVVMLFVKDVIRGFIYR